MAPLFPKSRTLPFRFRRSPLSKLAHCGLNALQAFNLKRTGNLLHSASPGTVRIAQSVAGVANSIAIGQGVKGKLRVNIRGNCNVIHIGDNVRFIDSWSTVVMQCNHSRLQIGFATTTNGTTFQFAEDETSIVVGNDCMFAGNTHIWVTDFHSVVTLGSGRRINSARSVTIGDHVWLAADVKVLKNVQIASGSLVGASSVVTRSIAANTIAIGVPARPVLGGITWKRTRD